MEYLATPEAARRPGSSWEGSFRRTRTVPLGLVLVYPNDDLAAIVAEADTLGFDASVTRCRQSRPGMFWSGMVDWVAANGENTEEVFPRIEDSWPTG